jgi:hypothetical protein
MKKLTINAIMVLFISFMLYGSAAMANSDSAFTDIEGSFAEQAILDLTAKGIIKGITRMVI